MSNNPNDHTVISVNNLTFVYPGGITALEDVDLEVRKGEFVAVIGQNGAGKTTLTKHFNGLLKPVKGDLWIDGINTKKSRTADLAHKVGYCFQNPDHQIFNDTVWNEVAYGPKQLGYKDGELDEAVNWALETFELTGVKDQHPFVLSKGERQRVAIAAVLAMRPSILVVDEPTTGQDYREAKRIMDLFKTFNEDGVTVLVVTHDMQLVAEYAKRTIVMGLNHILIDDSTNNVFSQVDVLQSTHLRPPQITHLGFELGFSDSVLTVSDMVELLNRH